MGDIASLRRQYRQKRRAIDTKTRELYSRKAAELLLPYIKEKAKRKKVGVFFSLKEEIDTRYLIEMLWELGYQLYLPIVVAKGEALLWRSYAKESIISSGSYGVNTPVFDGKDETDAPELVVTPLVAYDDSGARIGMGGGFYDRTFADKISSHSPYLVGFAYRCQNCGKIERRPWDVYLDALANEEELLEFNKEKR